MEIELWRLSRNDVFKFSAVSDLFSLHHFDIRYIDEPFDRQIAIIKNHRTGKLSSCQSFVTVFIPPFDFHKQLTLF